MECERIEAMLPLFVARDLPADEAAAVSSHLDACERCREALVAFTALEATLLARRDQVPPVDAFLPDLRAAGFRARHSIMLRAFRAAMSVPGVAIVLVMWATLLVMRYNDKLTGDISSTTSLERWTALAKRGLDGMVAAAGGDAWTLTAVYGALAIGVIVSAGALTMRLVRD
jgi:predicted anti-sigma-YlaC factor YlaD